MRIVFPATAALLLIGSASWAGGQTATPKTATPAKPATKTAAKPAPVLCAVTGEAIPNVKTAEKSVYKGKTYYFCCGGCKPMFDKNPAKYAKADAPKPAPKPAAKKAAKA